MREFRNPIKAISGIFSSPKSAPVAAPVKAAAVAAPTTSDGDAEKKKKTRGVSNQRSTLLTPGSVVGADTRRRTLLGSVG